MASAGETWLSEPALWLCFSSLLASSKPGTSNVQEVSGVGVGMGGWHIVSG